MLPYVMDDVLCFNSVITTRFVLGSRSECVYLSPTTDCLSVPFPRVKRRSRLLRSFLKSQVKSFFLGRKQRQMWF